MPRHARRNAFWVNGSRGLRSPSMYRETTRLVVVLRPHALNPFPPGRI
jgi:hypothetical protein